MCNDNEQKLIDRENQYKQYFTKFDENMHMRQDLHDMTAGV